MRGIHRWPVKSPYKGPVTRKIFPFDDVIIWCRTCPGPLRWVYRDLGFVTCLQRKLLMGNNLHFLSKTHHKKYTYGFDCISAPGQISEILLTTFCNAIFDRALVHFDLNCTEVSSIGSDWVIIGLAIGLVSTGDKALTEQVLTWFTDEYIYIYVSPNFDELNHSLSWILLVTCLLQNH